MSEGGVRTGYSKKQYAALLARQDRLVYIPPVPEVLMSEASKKKTKVPRKTADQRAREEASGMPTPMLKTRSKTSKTTTTSKTITSSRAVDEYYKLEYIRKKMELSTKIRLSDASLKKLVEGIIYNIRKYGRWIDSNQGKMAILRASLNKIEAGLKELQTRSKVTEREAFLKTNEKRIDSLNRSIAKVNKLMTDYQAILATMNTNLAQLKSQYPLQTPVHEAQANIKFQPAAAMDEDTTVNEVVAEATGLADELTELMATLGLKGGKKKRTYKKKSQKGGEVEGALAKEVASQPAPLSGGKKKRTYRKKSQKGGVGPSFGNFLPEWLERRVGGAVETAVEAAAAAAAASAAAASADIAAAVREADAAVRARGNIAYTVLNEIANAKNNIVTNLGPEDLGTFYAEFPDPDEVGRYPPMNNMAAAVRAFFARATADGWGYGNRVVVNSLANHIENGSLLSDTDMPDVNNEQNLGPLDVPPPAPIAAQLAPPVPVPPPLAPRAVAAADDDAPAYAARIADLPFHQRRALEAPRRVQGEGDVDPDDIRRALLPYVPGGVGGGRRNKKGKSKSKKQKGGEVEGALAKEVASQAAPFEGGKKKKQDGGSCCCSEPMSGGKKKRTYKKKSQKGGEVEGALAKEVASQPARAELLGPSN